MLAWAEKAFQQFPTGVAKAIPNPYIGGDVRLKAETDGVAYVALAFPVPAGEAGCLYYAMTYPSFRLTIIFTGKPYEVLHNVLASRLSGAAIAPFLTKYSHGGILGFYAVASSGETAKLLETAVEQLKSVASGVASIDAAKNQVSFILFLFLF